LAPVKWAGWTIDVVQILLVSTHNYFRSTYLHTSELELSPISICILLYDQSYSCNTPLSPHAYVLATESFSFTISGENWKTVATAAVLFSLLELNHCHHYFFVEFIDIQV
jgi:hypothetical protein